MNDAVGLLEADARARASALDITRSWLVQAPAGSGKTELLIQRFLALLATVDRPERIVATTFTRKAAAEMRARIIEALSDSADDCANAALDEHEARTRKLARRVIDRDRALGWRLFDQPGRLRIMTIDALAAAIARQVPLAAGVGELPTLADDARALYRAAARAALASAPANDPDWRAFLEWLDNDAATAVRTLAAMLEARDRWPVRLFDENATALRADIETVLQKETRAAIAIVRGRIPASLARALPGLARCALDFFGERGTMPAYAFALEGLCRDRSLPGPDAREAWCGLGAWLLTQAGGFFRRVTFEHGFPPTGNGAGAQRRKDEFVAWLEEAARVPGLADAWHRLRQLPPARFDDAAWAFVAATMKILARAADALENVFRARGEADHAEGTLRALAALGSEGDPSDLLLSIDYRLSHLLIDEFQDTSSAQLALIGRLTEGFEQGDGRTVFAVGDPMQSIYRFRQADVGLFLRAQATARIGNVPVGVVDLARNFRSQRAIVEWVNDVFGVVLPPVSDAARAEAAYRPAYADPGSGEHFAPTLDLAASRESEADVVVRRILEAQTAGIASVAVLVRARTHARVLLPALRRAGIAYSAVGLEDLRDRLATRDLLSLARAIAQPADRLAWLACLRAPWCGLTLAELLAIAAAASGRTVFDVLGSPESFPSWSPESRARAKRFLHAIEPALAARGRASFASRVRGAWLALGGPASAASPLDRDGADRVFALLAAHERGGELPDFAQVSEAAAGLFADAGESSPSAVQIMTMHKAKGLQFGAVILPGLDLPTGGFELPLLRWKVREHEGLRTLLLAPMRARIGVQAEADPVYRWLAALDRAEETAELGRLLYVASTRARQRLHLVGVARVESATDAPHGLHAYKRPRAGSALERVWEPLASRIAPPADTQPGPSVAPADAALSRPEIRLPVDWRLPPMPAPLPVASPAPSTLGAIAFDWAEALAAAIGTVAHRLLAQVACDGIDAWSPKRLRDEKSRILAELGSEGVERDLREEAAKRVADVLTHTLLDPRGRWLFDRAHADAHSEWSLAGEDDGRIAHIVVDRSFVAGGHRYIVDFKTGMHLGGDSRAFLARELERYRPQLVRYARIVRALDAHPIRIALYHPLVDGGWQEEEAPV